MEMCRLGLPRKQLSAKKLHSIYDGAFEGLKTVEIIDKIYQSAQGI